jgi:uncharacterized protein (TIGR00106 family)
MLAQFSIVPLGSGESVSEHVSKVLKTVDERGLPYRLTPMGTIVEGEWEEVMALIRTCHLEVLKGLPRVITTITIDDRPGKPDRITEKIRSVEKKLGRELKK